MQVYESGTGLFAELPILSGSQAPPHRARALARMQAQLEGEPVNHSEGRAVGHHWLRDPNLAPTPEIRRQIEQSGQMIRALNPEPCQQVLLIGIGGSALGVQMVSQALVPDPTRLICIDNADPQGIQDTLARVDPRRTIPVVVTKSGGTAETQSAWRAAKAHWKTQGQVWEQTAIAVTGPGSRLDQEAKNWKARFPVWPWVGGRFCITSPAGLVPLRLLGVDIDGLLAGAASVDAWTNPQQENNFALCLAEQLFSAQQDAGLHGLAILAYRDRLQLMSRYLQQLLMESLGKSHDLNGASLSQGFMVLGERGSTDQHSILQYLSQGRNDTLTVLIDSRADAPAHEELADAHLARLLGTYQALRQTQRPPLLLSIPKTDARSIGALIALFENCVGYYAGLANLNAYDQPGVESGKKASTALLKSKQELAEQLSDTWERCDALAAKLDLPLAVTWRLAMQWVVQQKAEHRPNAELGAHAFRSRS